jgi:SOS-response transcriptional repressor LexA
MLGLTRRQTDCLDFIKGYIRENEIAPSVVEIGSALGIAKQSVLDLLRNLESKGAIYRQRYRARTIVVIGDAKATVDPILIARLRAWDAKEKKIKALIRAIKKEEELLPPTLKIALDEVAKILFEEKK